MDNVLRNVNKMKSGTLKSTNVSANGDLRETPADGVPENALKTHTGKLNGENVSVITDGK